jgi:hypothetical protein
MTAKRSRLQRSCGERLDTAPSMVPAGSCLTLHLSCRMERYRIRHGDIRAFLSVIPICQPRLQGWAAYIGSGQHMHIEGLGVSRRGAQAQRCRTGVEVWAANYCILNVKICPPLFDMNYHRPIQKIGQQNPTWDELTFRNGGLHRYGFLQARC